MAARDLGVSRLVTPTRALGARNPLEGLEKLGNGLARIIREDAR